MAQLLQNHYQCLKFHAYILHVGQKLADEIRSKWLKLAKDQSRLNT